MGQEHSNQNGKLSPDRLVRGALAKIGDMLDRATGRGWQPTSSLATSELIEKLKVLLDLESATDEKGRTFVPHFIRLNMQWDKFAADSDESLRTLENELLIAAVDHINDRNYYTRGPLRIEARPDYFTNGVVLRVSFAPIGSEERETSLQLNRQDSDEEPASATSQRFTITARFESNGRPTERKFELSAGERLTIGRGKSNDLALGDESVSKVHSSLYVTPSFTLMVADTGSTNGTFVNGQRISYGKAVDAGLNPRITFGAVAVEFAVEAIGIARESDELEADDSPEPNAASVDALLHDSGSESSARSDEHNIENV